MPYTAAVFDLDGTLLDTLEDLYRATNAALSAHSLPLRTRDEVRMFVGNGVEMLIRRAVPEGSEEGLILGVLDDFKTTYAAICEEHTAPYDGVLPLLTALRERGVRVAVVSNKFDAATKQLCAKYFGDLVEIAIGERAGIRKKPAPDTVLEALRTFDLTAESAVFVGDSDVDIRTAENCGMDCISVTWGLRDEDFLLQNGAEILVDTPESLLGVIIA